MSQFMNEEFLMGNLEAARQAAETEAMNMVEQGITETNPVVYGLDQIVTAIEAYQSVFGSDE